MSCTPQAQVTYTAQCSANLTLVLDDSPEVRCCRSNCVAGQTPCQSLRNSVVNLVNAAFQQSLLGVPVYVSVIRFASTVTLDFPMTKLTQAFVAQFTTWINANYLTGNSGLGLYSNWADALQLAYASDPSPLPNLLVMFVASNPTVSGPRHVPACSQFGPSCNKQVTDSC